MQQFDAALSSDAMGIAGDGHPAGAVNNQGIVR
jgi:hypothetical protein